MSKFTKQAIRQACLELLGEKPFDKVTVKDIVMRCELNRNTFYYYYRDIYDVLEDIFVEERESLRQQLSGEGSFYESHKATSAIILQHKSAVLHLAKSRHQDILMNYLTNVVRDFVRPFVEYRARDARLSEQDIRYIVSFYSCAIIDYTRHWILDGMNEDGEELLLRLSDTFELTIDILIGQCQNRQYQIKDSQPR